MVKNKRIFFRRLLMLIVLATTAVAVRAANVQYLQFVVKGSPVVISLAEHPVITYTGNTLHIVAGDTTIDIPVADITGTAFQESTGIGRPTVEAPQMTAGKLLFSGLPAESRVAVYTSDGQAVHTAVAGTDGQATVDFLQLPAGAYVVKSATQTIKIVNK